ncbi:MAG: cell division protein ZapA [Balneolaceae bacterium]
MESLKVTILGKQYPLKVDENEVENMKRIAGFVDEKFRLYRRELSKQPESTIMVLAALSIAEELFEARRKVQEKSEEGDEKLMAEVNSSIEKLLEGIKNET